MYKPNAVTFKVPNGFDNFSGELKALLFDLRHVKAPYGYNYKDDPTYNNEPILWVDKDDIDSLLQNDEFWEYLLSSEIIPYLNISIRVLIDDATSKVLSNDNSKAFVIANKGFVFGSGDKYVSNEEH